MTVRCVEAKIEFGQERTIVRVTINPGLRVRLSALDRGDVVGFTVIVPGEDLDEVELVTVLNDAFPAGVVEVVVGVVDELQNNIKYGALSKNVKITHVLVEAVGSIVSEEPGANASHVCFGARSCETVETTDGSIVLVVGSDELSQCLSCGVKSTA